MNKKIFVSSENTFIFKILSCLLIIWVIILNIFSLKGLNNEGYVWLFNTLANKWFHVDPPHMRHITLLNSWLILILNWFKIEIAPIAYSRLYTASQSLAYYLPLIYFIITFKNNIRSIKNISILCITILCLGSDLYMTDGASLTLIYSLLWIERVKEHSGKFNIILSLAIAFFLTGGYEPIVGLLPLMFYIIWKKEDTDKLSKYLYAIGPIAILLCRSYYLYIVFQPHYVGQTHMFVTDLTRNPDLISRIYMAFPFALIIFKKIPQVQNLLFMMVCCYLLYYFADAQNLYNAYLLDVRFRTYIIPLSFLYLLVTIIFKIYPSKTIMLSTLFAFTIISSIKSFNYLSLNKNLIQEINNIPGKCIKLDYKEFKKRYPNFSPWSIFENYSMLNSTRFLEKIPLNQTFKDKDCNQMLIFNHARNFFLIND